MRLTLYYRRNGKIMTPGKPFKQLNKEKIGNLLANNIIKPIE